MLGFLRTVLGAILRRYLALDSLRGLCAIFVALFHYPALGDLRAFPLIGHGYLFVDFFFVLSGFVIASAYEGRLGREGGGGVFLVRRFGRLWPLHAFMLGVFVLAALAKGEIGTDERHSVFGILTNLTFLHGLGIHGDLTWNGPSWSISVEAALYLLFAALAFCPKRPVVYGLLVGTSCLVLSFIAPNGMNSTFDFGIFRGLAGFFTGCLIVRLRPRVMGTVAELATLALVVAFIALDRAQVLAPLVFGLAVYVFAVSRGWAGRLLEFKPFVKLGEWSYSIYLTHAAVVAGMLAFGLDRQSYGVPLFLALTIGLSALTYTFIETPGRAFFNAIAARHARRMRPSLAA